MEQETFWTLFFSWPHWLFEIFLMFLFDFLIGVILWPLLKKFTKHHRGDDINIETLQQQVKEMRVLLGLKDEKEKDEA